MKNSSSTKKQSQPSMPELHLTDRVETLCVVIAKARHLPLDFVRGVAVGVAYHDFASAQYSRRVDDPMAEARTLRTLVPTLLYGVSELYPEGAIYSEAEDGVADPDHLELGGHPITYDSDWDGEIIVDEDGERLEVPEPFDGTELVALGEKLAGEADKLWKKPAKKTATKSKKK